MKRKLLELKAARSTALTAAEAALSAENQTEYAAKMEEIKGLNQQIDRLDALIAEQDRYEVQKIAFGGMPTADDRSKTAQLTELRKSNEYVRAWGAAMKAGANVAISGAVEAYAPLYKALTISGGDVTGEDGGFLVPADVDTRINELCKEYLDLSPLCHVETVESNSGYRVLEKSGTRTPLPKIEENDVIQPNKQPKFTTVQFNCANYGDRIPISGALLEDAPALMAYLAQWFAPKLVLTRNSLILQALASASPFVAFTGADDVAKVKEIKTVLNKTLNTAHSARAHIITNANGYDVLDSLCDANGRPYFGDGVADLTHIKGRPLHRADIDILPDITHNSKTYAPLYIGDLASAVAVFLRSGLRVDVTSVGGDAWARGGSEMRAMTRMDVKALDPAAVALCGWEV